MGEQKTQWLKFSESGRTRRGARRMNRNMILAEWLRAYACLQAAENLTRDGLYADAISRAYYAILHAAKAGLHVHDIAAESHSAVRRMFGLHLIKSGDIETEWSAYLTAGLDDRLAADYGGRLRCGNVFFERRGPKRVPANRRISQKNQTVLVEKWL